MGLKMAQFKNQHTKAVMVGYIETENYVVEIGATDSRVTLDGSYEPMKQFENLNSGALWFQNGKLCDSDGGPMPKEVEEAIKYMGYEL
tara:strand:+ start:221 stop:484 length:264 start_codon:yes stop_codon:yes gene_type:complete